MKAVLLWMIRFYRKYISPARPPCCRFIPTCSAYALEAIEKIRRGQRGLSCPAANFTLQPLSPAEERRV